MQLLHKWLEQEHFTSLEQMKYDWIRTILFHFARGMTLQYLVKDKNPKNVLQAFEYADSISEIRDPWFSEVKIGRKVWQDSKTNKNKCCLSQAQAKGSHLGETLISRVQSSEI